MLQATGYPAEITDFNPGISAGYWGVFLVATIVRLVMLAHLPAAMLVFQFNPVGVELFSYANALFCSNKFA